MTDASASPAQSPPAATMRTPSAYAAAPWARWCGAVLVILAVAVYARTLLYGFVLDDTTVIRANALVHSWQGLLSAWTHPYWAEQGGNSRSGLYRPLLVAIFTVIWNAGHRFALWFHLFAVAAHATAAWLVWRLLRRAVGVWPAFIAALWFAAHPVHVEAVASVANVSEVLVTIAAVLLAFVVMRAADAKVPAVSWGTALLGTVLFAAAALVKESGLVIPALALVCAWGWQRPGASPSAEPDAGGVLHRWWRPMLLGAVALVLILAARRAVIGAAVGPDAMAAPGLEGLSAWQRAWAMLSLGPRILQLLAWPGTLLPHYGPEVMTATRPSFAGVLTLVVLAAAVTLGIALARRGDRRVLAGLMWMLIAFLPASNLLVATGQILAERTLYGASVGAAMLVAWGVASVLHVVASAPRPRAVAVRVAVAVVACVAIGWNARHAVQYARVWRSHQSLFSYLAAADPAGYRSHWLLALEAQNASRPDSALRELGRAFALYRGDRQLTIDYTNALLAAGRPRNAADVAENLMHFPDMRADSNAVGLYLETVARGFGADSARALARVLAPGVRRAPR